MRILPLLFLAYCRLPSILAIHQLIEAELQSLSPSSHRVFPSHYLFSEGHHRIGLRAFPTPPWPHLITWEMNPVSNKVRPEVQVVGTWAYVWEDTIQPLKKNTGICYFKNPTNDSYWETLLLSIPSVNRWETRAGRDESRPTQRLSDNVTVGWQVSSIPPASLPIRQTAFWSSDVVVPALIYEDEHLSGYFQLP